MKHVRRSCVLPVANIRLPSRPDEEAAAESNTGTLMKEKRDSGAPPKVKSVPYPEILKTTEPDVSKFMEIFKNLQVNIPFADW